MNIKVDVVVMMLMIMVLVIDVLLALIDVGRIILLVFSLLLPIMPLRSTRPGMLLTFQGLVPLDLWRRVEVLDPFLWRSRFFFRG